MSLPADWVKRFASTAFVQLVYTHTRFSTLVAVMKTQTSQKLLYEMMSMLLLVIFHQNVTKPKIL